MAKKRKAQDHEYIASICERVYRISLGEKDAASMVQKDGDNGEKLRRRAMAYETLVRRVLEAIDQEKEKK